MSTDAHGQRTVARRYGSIVRALRPSVVTPRQRVPVGIITRAHVVPIVLTFLCALNCGPVGTREAADERALATAASERGATSPGAALATPVAPTAFALRILDSRYGLIVAETAPTARCSASARLPSGRTSTAQGLSLEAVADRTGRVSWTYGTSGNTNAGTGVHSVRCSYQGQTKTATAEFRV